MIRQYESRSPKQKPRKPCLSKLWRPVTIGIVAGTFITITAIALKFPGRIEFRGGNQGVVIVIDGGGKD
jgi:hypothetical protein